MIFKKNNHNIDLYNTLLTLARNTFFYKNLRLKDNFETRIYLMFIHFSIIMIIYKKKGIKFDQKSYDYLFFNIENDLRELGFGDVTVNKKMKELNKILYDILLKIEISNKQEFKINLDLLHKYFEELKSNNDEKSKEFEKYLNNFFDFCFELPLNSMIREAIKFRI